MRKTVCGRVSLFLPNESTVLRTVKSNAGAQTHDTASVFHLLPAVHTGGGSVRCWHCGDDVARDKIFSLPRAYDPEEKKFFVYGACCSPECAKAYILEHSSFDRGQQLNTLARMLYTVHGISDEIKEMPPRASLMAFGGSFDPSKFRDAQRKSTLRMLEPPFVSYCMLVEERSSAETRLPTFVPVPDVEEEDAFAQEMPPSLFDEYVRQRSEEDAGAGKAKASSSWDAGAARKQRR